MTVTSVAVVKGGATVVKVSSLVFVAVVVSVGMPLDSQLESTVSVAAQIKSIEIILFILSPHFLLYNYILSQIIIKVNQVFLRTSQGHS